VKYLLRPASPLCYLYSPVSLSVCVGMLPHVVSGAIDYLYIFCYLTPSDKRLQAFPSLYSKLISFFCPCSDPRCLSKKVTMVAWRLSFYACSKPMQCPVCNVKGYLFIKLYGFQHKPKYTFYVQTHLSIPPKIKEIKTVKKLCAPDNLATPDPRAPPDYIGPCLN